MLYKSTELTNTTVTLINKFQTGEIKPISVGIPHLDKVLMGGLLPSTILGIVARSQNGKSYDLERIQRHLLDTQEDVVIVNCNWELTFFKILVRDICQRTGKTMDEVLFNNPTEEELKKLGEICKIHRNENIYYQNEPVNAKQFAVDIDSIIQQYPGKKIVVSIDNLENVLDEKGSQKTAMDALLYEINRLKGLHPYICFIILNQMNDNYILRADNIKSQRPIESDVYGSGQLLKLCDVLYIKMLPWRLGIREKFMVFGKDSYAWIEDYKIYADNGNTASFEPLGVAYYFYLKRRNADIKDIQDVFAERIFKSDELKNKFPTTKSINTSSTPLFTTPTFERESIVPLGNLNDAFGSPLENIDEPF